MPEKGNARARNPNICASCSSMADSMDEPFDSNHLTAAVRKEAKSAAREAAAAPLLKGEAAEPARHRAPTRP